MADFTQEQIVQTLGALTVMEVLELTRTLESKWGVSATPVPLIGEGASIPLTTAKQEKTEFTVTLVEAGPNKINVLKVVREVTLLGLKEAKDLVDGAPKSIKEAISQDEALELKQKLESAGAKVLVE